MAEGENKCPIQEEVRQAYRSCQTLGDAEGRLRGNTFAQLTLRINSSKALLDGDQPVSRNDLVIELRELEQQKIRGWYLNSLILDNYEKNEDLKTERASKYLKSRDYCAGYEKRWQECRARLYARLADLDPTPEILAAAEQSKVDPPVHASLYIPPIAATAATSEGTKRTHSTSRETGARSRIPPSTEKEGEGVGDSGLIEDPDHELADQIFHSPLSATAAATSKAAPASTATADSDMIPGKPPAGAAAASAQTPAFAQAAASMAAQNAALAQQQGLQPAAAASAHMHTPVYAPSMTILAQNAAAAQQHVMQPAVPSSGPGFAPLAPQQGMQQQGMQQQGLGAAATTAAPLPSLGAQPAVAAGASFGMMPQAMGTRGPTPQPLAGAGAAGGFQQPPLPFPQQRQPAPQMDFNQGREPETSLLNMNHLPQASLSSATSTSTVSQSLTSSNIWQPPSGQDPISDLLRNLGGSDQNVGAVGGQANVLDPSGLVGPLVSLPQNGHVASLAPGGPVGPSVSHSQNDPTIGFQREIAQEAENLLASGGGGPRDTGDMSLIRLYSQGLAANFDVNNIIKVKFSGSRQEFPNFILLWSKVHRLTKQYGFSPQEQFAILKQTLSGPALNYVKDLPADAPLSYSSSIRCLYEMFYSRGTNLATIIQTLVATPPSNGSFESRQRVHCALQAYSNSCAAISASPSHIQCAWEFYYACRLLDPRWTNDWVKFFQKRRNLNHPLGAEVDFQSFTHCLKMAMMEQYQQLQFNKAHEINASGQPIGVGNRFRNAGNRGYAAPASVRTTTNENGGESRRAPLASASTTTTAAAAAAVNTAAAAAANRRDFPNRGDRGRGGDAKPRNKVIVPCCFCDIGDNRQERLHKFPLTCFKIKNRMLSQEQIREIGNKAGVCRMCFSKAHKSRDCDTGMTCGVRDSNNVPCKEKHYRAYHNTNVRGKVAAAASAPARQH